MTNSEIMNAARNTLNAIWMREAGRLFLFWFLVCLLYIPELIIEEFLNEESIAVDIVSFIWELALLPLSIGIAFYYNNLSQNKVRSIRNFFHGYSSFLRNLRACLLKYGVIIVLIIVSCIPLVLCLFDNIAVIGVSIITTLLLGFFLFYKFFGTIVFYDWRIGEDTKTGVITILRDCYRRMQLHNDQFFTLNVRFIGWHILCVCTLGIAIFWIMPYLYSSYGIFYHKYVYPVEESTVIDNIEETV